MGRPKLSDLSCSVCNIIFKRKTHLENHMKTHSTSKPLRKHSKNYCYVCRKSFEPDEYKLHVQTEHQFDLPKVNKNTTDDLFSCEDGFVILSKKKIKKENCTSDEKISAIEKGKSLVVSVTDIKIEPTDIVNEESDGVEHLKAKDKTSIKQNSVQLKIPKLKCPICGIRCKGQKGLKIHMCSHKRDQNNSYVGASANGNKNDDNTLESNTEAVSSQINLPYDCVPAFDCDSEKYVKWLKKFVSKCKMHSYPLNPELCKKISIVTDDLSTALGNPTGSLRQKANHFYFMSTYNILSEIKLNHLQYVLCGIRK